MSGLRADVLTLQWFALRPKHAERYSAIATAWIEIDRNADEAEADCAGPEGPCTRFLLVIGIGSVPFGLSLKQPSSPFHSSLPQDFSQVVDQVIQRFDVRRSVEAV